MTSRAGERDEIARGRGRGKRRVVAMIEARHHGSGLGKTPSLVGNGVGRGERDETAARAAQQDSGRKQKHGKCQPDRGARARREDPRKDAERPERSGRERRQRERTKRKSRRRAPRAGAVHEQAHERRHLREIEIKIERPVEHRQHEGRDELERGGKQHDRRQRPARDAAGREARESGGRDHAEERQEKGRQSRIEQHPVGPWIGRRHEQRPEQRGGPERNDAGTQHPLHGRPPAVTASASRAKSSGAL